MPALVGYAGDAQHDKLVQEFIEHEGWLRQQLTPVNQGRVANWRYYLADYKDTRGLHEKWRADTKNTYAYSATEVKSAALSEIMLGSDPYVQAEGLGTREEPIARKMERLLSYCFGKNSWPSSLMMNLREASITGTAAWKPVWANKVRKVMVHPTADQIKAFEEAVDNAVKMGCIPPPDARDVEAFRDWRETVNTSQLYGKIPDAPYDGLEEIIEYRGPWLERIAMSDLRYDPMIETVQDQPVFGHRVVRSKRWVLERTGPGPDKKFDPKQVAFALESVEGERFEEWENEVAAMLGLARAATDPLHEGDCELFEMYYQGSLAPYRVYLNRKAIINKRPDQMPYWHGQIPLCVIRNIPLPRRFDGLSDYHQVKSLFSEMRVLRNLRLDAITLAVLPLFFKRKNMGLPEIQRFLKPAGIIDVDDPQGLQAVTKWNQGIQDVFREIPTLKEDVDDTVGTPPHVRGSTATVGRISATETERRFNQAMVRQKQHCLRLEDELQPIVDQSLFLIYQLMPERLKLRIGGSNAQIDPFLEMNRAEFLEALHMGFRFRGATKTLNKELTASQLQQFLQLGSGLQLLDPNEQRQLLKRIYETLGLRGVDQIITDEGTRALIQQRLAMAAAANAAATGQPPPGQTPPTPAAAPTTVPIPEAA